MSLVRRTSANSIAHAGLVGVLLAGAYPRLVTGQNTLPAQDGSQAPEEPQERGTLEQYVKDRLTFSGLAAGSFQFLLADEADGGDQEGGAITIRPSFDFQLSDADQLHVTFALTGGNGVNNVSPVSLAPWGADLEDDLVDINGSDVDYLQRAWYRRTFEPSSGQTLALTAGFIDSTEYLDQNEFANDEYTQFMNEVFVNAPTGFFPSYDLGAAAEWSTGEWSVNTAVMRVSENDDGNSYLFAGAQVGYHVESELGAGNYRLTLSYASDEFLDPDGMSTSSLLGLHLSADQELNEFVGV